MRAAKVKPITITVGNVQVKIYRRTRKKGDASYPVFDVADFSDGRRKLISYASEREARAKAELIAKKLANSEGAVLALTKADVAAYCRALDLLKPTGMAIELVAAQFAEVHQKLGGRSLVEAVNYYLKRHPSVLPRRSVPEVFHELLAAKEADGSSAVYLKDLKFRVGKFAADFQCQIADVSEAPLNEWLRGIKGSARNRNNFRDAVRVLFNFAESCGYLAKDHIDFERVARAKGEQGEIGIFTPDEMVKLLNAAQLNPAELEVGFNLRYATGQGLMPLLLLGGFAGLRTAEIERQVWSDVMLDRGFIRVTGAKGNTAQKRLVPISDNLKQWLSRYWKPDGPCCDYGRTPSAIARLAERAGVEWKHNALRHSYGSYRMAQVQDQAKVSCEMGNSPRMVVRHYRELVLPEEAKTWFSITPETPTNVTVMPGAAEGELNCGLRNADRGTREV